MDNVVFAVVKQHYGWWKIETKNVRGFIQPIKSGDILMLFKRKSQAFEYAKNHISSAIVIKPL